jgi:hypothetical protein
MNIARLVLVTKRTPYEGLLHRHGTHGNAAFLLQSRGDQIEQYFSDHEVYQKAVSIVESQCPRDINRTMVEHKDVLRFHFRPTDVVIVIGPDGLFVNVAKYLDGQPVIAVNPDPRRIDGVVMRTRPDQVGAAISMVVEDAAGYDEVVLAEATTPEGGRLLAINDFLIGRRDQISARYTLSLRGFSERQSSSGILVSTGMGASGWFRSICTAVEAAGGDWVENIPDEPRWDESRLVFAVREPFPSRQTGTEVVYGSITDGVSLQVTSEMPEGGVVFSDGVPSDALLLPAGMTVTIGVAPERVRLVRV